MSLQRGYWLTLPIIEQTGQDSHAKVRKKVKQFRMKFCGMLHHVTVICIHSNSPKNHLFHQYAAIFFIMANSRHENNIMFADLSSSFSSNSKLIASMFTEARKRQCQVVPFQDSSNRAY